MCEELINIVLFYGSAHRKVNKGCDFLVFLQWMMWQTRLKLTELNTATKIVLNIFWNILKVVQCIAVANNNCIHVNKGEIWIWFWKLQGKTSHALRGAGSCTIRYTSAKHAPKWTDHTWVNLCITLHSTH